MTANHNATRRIVRTTLSAAALALVISPLAGLAVANADYKESDFASCLERDMPTDYCCEHAGGVMRNGACINPDDLRVPSRVESSQIFWDVQPVQPTPPTKVPPHVIADGPILTATQ
ncbi:hypothetical protein [Mycobacterium sp. MMS18-G62]